MSDYAGKMTGPQIDALPGRIQNIINDMGDIKGLTTTVKTDIVSAINSLVTAIKDLPTQEGGSIDRELLTQLVTTEINKLLSGGGGGRPTLTESELAMKSGGYHSVPVALKAGETLYVESSFPTRLLDATDFASKIFTLVFSPEGNGMSYSYTAQTDLSVVIFGDKIEGVDYYSYHILYGVSAASTSSLLSELVADAVSEILSGGAGGGGGRPTLTESELAMKSGGYHSVPVALKAGETLYVESSFRTRLLDATDFASNILTMVFSPEGNGTSYSYKAQTDLSVVIFGDKIEDMDYYSYHILYGVSAASATSPLSDIWEAIEQLRLTKIDMPADGTPGQVLIKTEDGVAWADGGTSGGGGCQPDVNWLTDSASVVVEESSNPQWTVGGVPTAVSNILNADGSYVIDVENKKYARLSSANHGKFADGTPWTGTWGEAFRRLPRVYYAVRANSAGQSVLHLSCSDGGSGSWDETWTGIYKGSVDANGKLHSRPGVETTQSKTISAFFKAAQKTSPDMGLVSYLDHCKLGALYLARFGNSDSSINMGPGLQDASTVYYPHTTGYTATLGDGSGEMPYAKTEFGMNKLFGIEDLAGSTFEFRSGIRFDGENAIVYDGNIFSTDIAAGDEGYVRTVQRTVGLSASYIKSMVLGPDFDLIPLEGGGSSTTYWCDAAWSHIDGQVLFVGGSANGGNYSGLFGFHSYRNFSYTSRGVGARLAFRGDISEYELVSGAELAALHA